MATTETPFLLSVPEVDIELLRQKLETTRFPDELEDAGWNYGVPLAHVKRLVARWKDEFDWRKSEAEINKIPQYTRDIDVEGFGTLNIHYVHQRSRLDSAIPLLFIHGWPGHFLEVRRILSLLTSDTPDQPSFHVVALSLPGFGFSEAPKKQGFAARQYAEVANKLMISLGYNEYVVQGGDWGHYIAGYLATFYAHTHVKGWLSNYTNAQPPSIGTFPWLYLTHLITPYTAREKRGLQLTAGFRQQGSGYSHEQATRPQTIGYSLADSPVGLLAWIYEKLVTWTDAYPWEDDEVLEWVSIYWFSRAGPAASVRIYKEMTDGFKRPAVVGVQWTSIPFGYSAFPKELNQVPRKWLQTLGNLVFESVHSHGGHFAAHEEPEELVRDIRNMFGKGGPAAGVVPGKNGYA
ncbi:alpha/beta-hydrolase [Dichomitus squalens]|uniref:Alpha/beta-hydrolase n=1 Tax=Dichomitus squalens TaxID=114155 RepID=A0A4Q9PPF9_9APHY|nr:alpha/beta-hydrolase [Dichomitus squalens]